MRMRQKQQRAVAATCDETRAAAATDGVRLALAELLKAYDYADSVDTDLWEFAVEISVLRQLGLTTTDARWLTSRNYVQHAREVTRISDKARQFRGAGKRVFSRRACFVLSAEGAVYARSILSHEGFDLVVRYSQPDRAKVRSGLKELSPGELPTCAAKLVPHWDEVRRELVFRGSIVKRYSRRAPNQERILTTFQEEDWPHRIDDPLAPIPLAEQDPKRRLNDTIKCLNRTLQTRLIRFHGDGTGEGIRWTFIDDTSSS